MKQEIVREFLEQAFDHLTSQTNCVVDKVRCFACGDGNDKGTLTCPVHPSKAERGERLYGVIGGNTCTEWSSMKVGAMKWLHKNTIDFIVWVADLLRQDPAFLLQECVRYFDVEPLAKLLERAHFIVQQVVFSPLDLGVPTHRMRSYILAVHKKQVKIRVPFQVPDLEPLFWRQVQASAKIYFRAPSSLLQAMLPHRSDEVADEDYRPESCMSVGDNKRLKKYLEVAQKKGLKFLCASVTQKSWIWLSVRGVPSESLQDLACRCGPS